MATSDPVADMLTRIRNGVRVGKKHVNIKRNKVCLGLAGVLKDEGYINGFSEIDDSNQGEIRIELKYSDLGESVIQDLQRSSKPGCRRYCGYKDIPRVLDGLGIAAISTSKGVLSDRRCRSEQVGGEVLCLVW
ncbi:MAG: 30S ribosomal protein S8 [Phycisphaerae bacterium]